MTQYVPAHKTTIMIHCLATPPSWGRGKTAQRAVDEVRVWHMRDRGWRDLGYAVIGDYAGNGAKGRDLNDDESTFDDTGAGARGHNYEYIHLALVGGKWEDGRWGLRTDKFSDHFTPEQDRWLRNEIAEINRLAGRQLRVIGHNEVDPGKGCPSFDVQKWLKEKPATKKAQPTPPTNGGFWEALARLFAPRPKNTAPKGLVAVPHDGRTVYVMPDFYKRDGIRMPVDLPEAMQIAEDMSRELGVTMRLPTREHVDSIHAAADVRLTMPTRTGRRQEVSTYRDVDAEIERALGGRGGLISGHKKEILRPARFGKVTIYGGLRPNGKFWQPRPSSVHHAGYTDYSHGLRLVYDPEDT